MIVEEHHVECVHLTNKLTEVVTSAESKAHFWFLFVSDVNAEGFFSD